MQSLTFSSLAIFFGDASKGIIPHEHYDAPDGASLLLRPQFNHLQQTLGIDNIVFLHQVHGTDGIVVEPSTAHTLRPFAADGDYLITKTNVALGILTADCLPIVMHDPNTKTLALVHAGWRGSVHNVVTKAIERMQREFGTQIAHLRIFFGPAAHVCCYQVSPDFLIHLDPFSYASETIQHRNNNLFFDTSLFNRLQLQAYGVHPSSINTDYSTCTICNEQFYSYRRQKGLTERQITIACLSQAV